MITDLSTLDCEGFDFNGEASDSDLAAGSDGLLDKNLLFTSGVLVAAGTGVAGAGLLLAAMPGQVVGASALAGGLMYAGQRKHEGKAILPWMDKEEATTSTPAKATAPAPKEKAEPVVQGVVKHPVTKFDGAEQDIEGL